MFAEFSENYHAQHRRAGDGDVKYHLGYLTTRKLKTGGEEVEVRLSANPSHLEAVNPVVQGMARARQRIRKDTDERKKVIAVLIHGDAAFAGQGIVAETLNMSQLQGYRIGGTIHIIVNNQIGFTTLPADARSTTYCTDVAKMIEAPIFHVNGDDPAGRAASSRNWRSNSGRPSSATWSSTSTATAATATTKPTIRSPRSRRCMPTSPRIRASARSSRKSSSPTA